jgi:hypothetical protein
VPRGGESQSQRRDCCLWEDDGRALLWGRLTLTATAAASGADRPPTEGRRLCLRQGSTTPETSLLRLASLLLRGGARTEAVARSRLCGGGGWSPPPTADVAWLLRLQIAWLVGFLPLVFAPVIPPSSLARVCVCVVCVHGHCLAALQGQRRQFAWLLLLPACTLSSRPGWELAPLPPAPSIPDTMRNLALGAFGVLAFMAGARAQSQCTQPCLPSTNGTFFTCDDVVAQFGYTCEHLETWHCCDCGGCCEEPVTTIAPCDQPCLGSYSAADLSTMLGTAESCAAAINDGLAPFCDLEACCAADQCVLGQECGFSCSELIHAGFTCEDAADAGCDCTECACTPEVVTTEPPADPCDSPCFELFPSISCVGWCLWLCLDTTHERTWCVYGSAHVGCRTRPRSAARGGVVALGATDFASGPH